MRLLVALCALTAASCSFLGGAGAPALRKARPALPVARFASMQAEAAAPSEDEQPMQSAKAGGPLAKLKESLPPPKELKKVLPLGLMFFFILFSYTILRDTKDVRCASTPHPRHGHRRPRRLPTRHRHRPTHRHRRPHRPARRHRHRRRRYSPLARHTPSPSFAAVQVLVVTAPKSGAEIIPFLKTYVNLPGAIGFTVLYSELTNRFSRETVFTGIVGFFVAFFVLFAAVIYPQQAFLHPTATVDALAAVLPSGFGAPLAIIRNWT